MQTYTSKTHLLKKEDGLLVGYNNIIYFVVDKIKMTLKEKNVKVKQT
jgi:hypothetical protein